jgi:hypothetical protein
MAPRLGVGVRRAVKAVQTREGIGATLRVVGVLRGAVERIHGNLVEVPGRSLRPGEGWIRRNRGLSSELSATGVFNLEQGRVAAPE